MAEFTICPYGDPILRAKGDSVKEFGPALRTLGEAMLRAMKAAKGIGLAAPQVGLSLQLFVMDVRDEDFLPVLDGKARPPAEIMPMLLANATVSVPAGEPETFTEGCLSFPGITGDVERVERAITGERRVALGVAHARGGRGAEGCRAGVEIRVPHRRPPSRPHQLLAAAKVKKLKRATTIEMKAARKAPG